MRQWRSYNKADRRSPGSLSFLLPLGNNLVWAEQYQAGIDVLNQLIRESPDTAEAYVRLEPTGLPQHRPSGTPRRKCFAGWRTTTRIIRWRTSSLREP